MNGIHEVTGSIPVRSTIFPLLVAPAMPSGPSVPSGSPSGGSTAEESAKLRCRETLAGRMTRLSDAILRAVAGLAPEGCGPRRLVIRFERDGSVVVETDTPEGSAPALETFDGLQPLPGRNAWRLSADRAGVPTEDDLFALHALAASRPDVRFIVKLPPEHVGRRW